MATSHHTKTITIIRPTKYGRGDNFYLFIIEWIENHMIQERKVWYAPYKNEAYGTDEINAVIECLHDGWLAGFGPRTVLFEKRVAELSFFPKNMQCL